MNHHAPQFRPSHYRSHQGGSSSCPMYFTYLTALMPQLHGPIITVAWVTDDGWWCGKDKPSSSDRLLKLNTPSAIPLEDMGQCMGPMGAVATVGIPMPMGAGCGTFLRIAVKDPDKKMCILEKKIKRFEKCCVNGKCFLKSKTRQCRKLRETQGELQTLLAAEGGPTTLATATDMAYQNVRTNIDQGENTLALAQAKTQRTLMIAAVSGVGILTAVYLLRR